LGNPRIHDGSSCLPAGRDVEIILQRAKEQYRKTRPRVISDNGPLFISKDFKEFIRIGGTDHVRTSPYYPQSNGKIERWHQSLKKECIRPRCPLSLEEARRIVADFVLYYNTCRLHSALGYITPKDKLEGRENEIFGAPGTARLKRPGNSARPDAEPRGNVL